MLRAFPTRVKGVSHLKIRPQPLGATRPRSDRPGRPRWPKLGARATLQPMSSSPTERRKVGDRRAANRRRVVVVVAVERRSEPDRRNDSERRTPDNVGEHIRNALQLLTNVAESGTLDEESLRDLDAAMFRLRFALDRCGTPE